MKFGFASLTVRWLMIMGVITALYNPSGRSFLHWAVDGGAPLSLRLAAGSLLLAALAYFFRLSIRALGPVGVLLLALLLLIHAAAVLDLGLVRLGSGAARIGFVQCLLATGLTVGVSWSALRTRISGQVDFDDISRRWNSMRLILALVALLVMAGQPGAARAEAAAGAASLLLIEPLTEDWRERLFGPLLARLLPLGPREVAVAPPAEALARIVAEPSTLALLRRSHLSAATAGEIEHLELGPAACLALVARAAIPASSYAELNYTDAGQPLRIVFASDNARELFERVHGRFPLGSATVPELRPALVGLQRLANAEADLLVLDVPRRSRSGVPAERLVGALARGHHLLSLPAALPAPGMGLLPGEVQLDAPPFWRQAATYKTFCDPFVLAMRRDVADRVVHRLHTPVPAAAREPSFMDQMVEAARGLGTLIASGLPL